MEIRFILDNLAYLQNYDLSIFNPFSHRGDCGGQSKFFNFSFRKDHQKKKNSYERRAYESVDDRRLYEKKTMENESYDWRG